MFLVIGNIQLKTVLRANIDKRGVLFADEYNRF